MKLDYETKEVSLTKEDMDAYVSPISPRDIRQRHVNTIHQSFNLGKHVEGIIAVNAVDAERKLEIIDGNHRMAAIRQWLSSYPKDAIRATLHIYRNLSPDEKKHLYMVLQNSVVQTKIDILKTQCYDTFLYKAFFSSMDKRSFPCRVQLNETVAMNSIKFFRLVEPYYYRNSRSAGTINKTDLPNIMKRFDKDDLARMAQYMTDFIEVFGEPHRELNRLYSGMAFHLGYQKIYWQGVNALGRAAFQATMKKNFAQIRGKVESVLSGAVHIQKEQAIQVYQIVREGLNRWEKRSMTDIFVNGKDVGEYDEELAVEKMKTMKVEDL